MVSIAVAVFGEGSYRVQENSVQVYSPNGEVELEYFIKGNTLQYKIDEGLVEVFERNNLILFPAACALTVWKRIQPGNG